MEKARPHTSPETLEKCVASEFLASCLTKAGFDTELCGDVTDACEVAELNALDLASGDLSSEEVASRLFLVDTEARKLLKVCARLCAREGVDFGAGVGDGESSEEEPPPPPPAPAEEKQGDDGAVDASVERSHSTHSRSLSSFGGEGGAPAPSAEELRAAQEKQEEEERRQQQIKEEQRAAAAAAFAPKPIPSSAATAVLAPQAMQGDGFPPGFSPPPPFGQPRKTHPAAKDRKDIPHARKLSAYDGNSFGIRGDSFTPPSARAQSARGPAPSPRTPATTTMTIHTPNTSRTSSVAANRYERPASKDSKPALSADAMKPANMTTPSKPTPSNDDMKPANMTTPISRPSPKSSTDDMKPANMATPSSVGPTPDGKAESEKKTAQKPQSSGRVPSYLRPTAAFQNQVKRTKEPGIDMMGKLTGSATTRAPIRPASTRLPPQYVHKAYHDTASPYGAKTHRARNPPGDDSSETSTSSSKIPTAPQTARPTTNPSPNSIRPPSSNLLKPTEAFLAATSGNNERKKQSNMSGGSTVLVNHTQSTVLSPSDITPQSKPFKARPMPKFMRPGNSTDTSSKAVPRTPRTHGPPAAPSQTPRGTAGKVLTAAQESQRRIELELCRLRQLQERLYELGEEGDDIDELCRVRTPSGRHSYITSSLLQPHPHIPMRELEKSSKQAQQQQQQSAAAQSRLPRKPAADDVVRQSAHVGTLIPNGYGQLSPAQKQRKHQLMEQHQQQAALIRTLSEEHSRSHPGHQMNLSGNLSHEAHVRSLEEGDVTQCGDVENDEGQPAASAHVSVRDSSYDNGNKHAPENGDVLPDRGASSSQAAVPEEGSWKGEQSYEADGQQPQQEQPQQQEQQEQQQEQQPEQQVPQEQQQRGEGVKGMQGSHLSHSGNHFYDGHVDENFTVGGVVQVELE